MIMELLTNGWLEANKVLVGVVITIVGLVTIAYLVRRLWRP